MKQRLIARVGRWVNWGRLCVGLVVLAGPTVVGAMPATTAVQVSRVPLGELDEFAQTRIRLSSLAVKQVEVVSRLRGIDMDVGQPGFAFVDVTPNGNAAVWDEQNLQGASARVSGAASLDLGIWHRVTVPDGAYALEVHVTAYPDEGPLEHHVLHTYYWVEGDVWDEITPAEFEDIITQWEPGPNGELLRQAGLVPSPKGTPLAAALPIVLSVPLRAAGVVDTREAGEK